MPEASQDWTPVASQAVGVFGQVAEPVQIAITIGVTLVALVAITALYFSRRDRLAAEAADTAKPDDEGVSVEMVRAILSTTGEFAAQVHHLGKVIEGLGETVEAMNSTIVGCARCPFHPNALKSERAS